MAEDRVRRPTSQQRIAWRRALKTYFVSDANAEGEYQAWCPVHEGDGNGHKQPSAGINIRKGVWHCFSNGCDKQSKSQVSKLVRELASSNGHKRPTRKQATTPRNPDPAAVVAIYKYTDEDGQLLFEVVRKAGKKFSQRRPNGRGGYIWKLGPTRRVLYHLPELQEAIERGDPVYVVEGEKDVKAIEKAGGAATCNPGGAGKWQDTFAESLEGASEVRIIADKDGPGRKHALAVASSLSEHGITFELLQPQNGKDAVDHLAAGYGLDDFVSFDGPDRESAEHRTDTGNARRLVAMYKDKILYCPAHKAWYIWDGKIWARDETLKIERLAKAMVRAMEEEAVKIEDREERDRTLRWCIQSESTARLKAMTENAKSDVAIEPQQLDSKPYLLCVENGTIDLKSGRLRKHDPEDLITLMAPERYDRNAADARWEEVLDRFVRQDEGKEEFLQRAAFASFTGTTEKAFLNLYDEDVGNTGKTTFVESLLTTLGPYGEVVNAAIFLTNRGGIDRIPDELAACYGKRMVVSSEVPVGRHLDTGLMKKLTGGAGNLRYERKYEKSWSGSINFTIWLDGNTVAKARVEDNPIFSRWRLTPFKHQIGIKPNLKWLEETNDPQYRAAVLAWVMRGRRAWLKEGIGSAPSVEKASAEVRESMDPLAEFWKDECRFGKDQYFTSSARLRLRVADWYTRHPQMGKPINDRDFTTLLRRKGAVPATLRVDKKMTRGWRGLRLKQ